MDFRLEIISRVRAFPGPEAGLQAIVDKAPFAEALAERWLQQTRPFRLAVYRARRRLATGGIIVLTVWLFLHVMFGANGMVVYRSKRSEYRNLQGDIDRLRQENDQFTRQIKALQNDPEAIEKEAREQLHYTRPGEYVYVPPNPKPDNHTARK